MSTADPQPAASPETLSASASGGGGAGRVVLAAIAALAVGAAALLGVRLGAAGRERDEARGEVSRLEGELDGARERLATERTATSAAREATALARGARDDARRAGAGAVANLAVALADAGEQLGNEMAHGEALAAYAAAIAKDEDRADARSGFAAARPHVVPQRFATPRPLPVLAAALAPDGDRVAVRLDVADAPDIVAVYDVASGWPVAVVRHDDGGDAGAGPRALALSGGGAVLAVASDTGAVSVYDVAGARLVGVVRGFDPEALAGSAARAGGDGDGDEGDGGEAGDDAGGDRDDDGGDDGDDPRDDGEDPPPPPAGLALSRDGALLGCAGPDGVVRVHAVATGALRARWSGRPADRLRGAAILRDPTGAASWVRIDDDGSLRVVGIPSSSESSPAPGEARPGEAVALAGGIPSDPRVVTGDGTTLRLGDERLDADGLGLAGGALVAAATGADAARLVVVVHDAPAVSVVAWSGAPGARTRSVRRIGENARSVASVSIDAGGRRIVEGAFGGRLRIRDGADGRLLRSVTPHLAGASIAAISPDGKLVASGGEDGAVRVFDVDKGEEVAAFGRIGLAVRALAWGGKSVRLAAGDAAGGVRIFDATKGEELGAAKFHQGPIHALSLSAKGDVLTTVGADRQTRRFQVDAKQALGEWAVFQTPQRAAALSPDGALLASASATDASREIVVLDLALQARRRYRGHRTDVSALVFSPDGARLASGDASGEILIWDAREAGEPVARIRGHDGAIAALAWAGEGGVTLVSGGWDGVVRAHDVSGGTPGVIAPIAPTLEPRAIVADPRGRWIGLASAREPARLIDPATPDADDARTVRGHRKAIASLAASPDGTLVASGARDGSVVLCTVEDGKAAARLDGHKGWVTSIAFDAAGKLIAAGTDDGAVRITDVTSKRRVITLEAVGAWVSGLALSPGGKLVASGGQDARVMVRKVAGGGTVHELRGHRGSIETIAWSPSGRFIATGGADAIVRIRDAVTGDVVAAARAGGPIRCVAFHPSGRWLAAAGREERVRIVAVPSGRLVATVAGIGPETSYVGFTARPTADGEAAPDAEAPGRLVLGAPRAKDHRQVVRVLDLETLGLSASGEELRERVAALTGFGVVGLRPIALGSPLR